MSNEQLKRHIDNRLDRIEQMLQGILQILESNIDAAQDAQNIRERLKKSQSALRQLEYADWFKENKGRVSTTAETEVGK